jgi:hypothetical protein
VEARDGALVEARVLTSSIRIRNYYSLTMIYITQVFMALNEETRREAAGDDTSAMMWKRKDSNRARR